MATSIYDIQAQATSLNPLGNGWTRHGFSQLALTSSQIVEKANPIGTKCWEIVYPAAPTADRMSFARWDSGLSAADQEVLMLARRSSNVTFQLAFARMASNDSRTAVGGGLLGNGDSSNSVMEQYAANTLSTLGTAASHGLGNPVNNWIWIRVRAATGTVYLRMWNDGDAEPGTWLRTETTTVTGANRQGFGIWHRNAADSCVQDIAWFSVASDGDTAPGPSPAVAPKVRVEGIKAPNKPDALVTGITTARVKLWVNKADVGAEDDVLYNQSITAGVLEFESNVGAVGDPVIGNVQWGTDPVQFGYFETTLVEAS
jgi:hypothetical protein